MKNFVSKNPWFLVTLTASILLFCGWLLKQPCGTISWTHEQQYRQFCYNDIVPLFMRRGLAEGKIPYVHSAIEYPVIIGAFMGAVGLPVNALGEYFGAGFTEKAAFYNLTALLLSLCALMVIWLLLKMRPSHPLDVLFLALAPPLMLSSTINWDMIAVLPATAGLYAWSRNRPDWAGVFIGIGIAAKLYPILFLFPIVLLALRAGKIRSAIIAIICSVSTWLIINLPVAILYPDNWSHFYRMSSERGIDWGTLWYILKFFDIRVDSLNLWYFGLFALGCLAVALLAFRAKRRPRIIHLIFLVLACFIITGKVWSPQYALWLLPLVVLIRPPVTIFILWMVAETAYFFAVFSELAGLKGNPIIPEWIFVTASIARLITLLIVCAYVVRDSAMPSYDKVRTRNHIDDPDGGVFNNAPDSPLAIQIQKTPWV